MDILEDMVSDVTEGNKFYLNFQWFLPARTINAMQALDV